MRALLIPVGDFPREIEINGDEALKNAVGGYIESCAWIFDNEPAIYVNEEGKYMCEPNRAIYATASDAGKITWENKVIEEGDVLDIVYGDFVAIGFNPSTGEDRDITDEEIDRVMERFGSGESVDSGIVEAEKIFFRGLSRNR